VDRDGWVGSLVNADSRSSVDSCHALLASLRLKSEKVDERRRESPPITFAGWRRLRRWESSIVKTRRSGDPTFEGEGSSSAMARDGDEMGLSGDRGGNKDVKCGGGEMFVCFECSYMGALKVAKKNLQLDIAIIAVALKYCACASITVAALVVVVKLNRHRMKT